MIEPPNPYQTPMTRMDAPPLVPEEMSILEPLLRSTGWTKFIGVMFIIIGCLGVLSIWGIIFAWIPIWMGVVLVRYSNLLREGVRAGDAEKCRQSMDRLRLFFKIFGILMIVYASILPLAIIAAILIPSLLTARGR
jgi:hypothetical protein